VSYQEHSQSVEIPKGTGIEGFLRAIREILALPRLQEIHIDARGKVSYKYFLREGEEERTLALEFDSLMPYAIVRNGVVQEVLSNSTNVGVVLAQMFARAAADHMYSVAWVAGANTTFWRWFDASMGFKHASQDDLFGLPFLRDRMVEDSVLILCTAYGPRAALTDTQRSYKILIPSQPK
jgi:hypothetical protein